MNPILPIAYPILLRLFRETGERTNLSLFAGAELVYAVRLHRQRAYDFRSALIGRRMPTYATAGGRAMLAKLADDDVDRILKESNLIRRTSKTKITHSEIVAQIRTARELGYAVVVGEAVEQETALAAAVVDHKDRPIAAIHIASSSSFWTSDNYCRQFAPVLMQAAYDLSEAVSEQ